MKLASSLRRVRARWRLHRIEWNAMHRPLQPPKGYEHFHSLEAVFPGMRGRHKKVQSFAQFRTILYHAWRLYRHNFIPDPHIARMENRLTELQHKKMHAKWRKIWHTGEKVVKDGADAMHDVAAQVRGNKPQIEQIVRDRVGVFRTAIHQFADGYQETSTGEMDVWGNQSYNSRLVKLDNAPVIYESIVMAPSSSVDAKSS